MQNLKIECCEIHEYSFIYLLCCKVISMATKGIRQFNIGLTPEAIRARAILQRNNINIAGTLRSYMIQYAKEIQKIEVKHK